VLGTGYRAAIDALSQQQRTQVHRGLLSELQSRNLTIIRADVVFGTANRPR